MAWDLHSRSTKWIDAKNSALMRLLVRYCSIGCFALLLLVVDLTLPAQRTTRYESPPEDLPRILAAQPVVFNHRLHAEQRLECTDCHPGAEKWVNAGLPGREQCMLCHQAIAVESTAIQELAALPMGHRIPWERVYQVPDFIFFSHASHFDAGVECNSCHGPVATRDVLDQEISTNMVVCMNCHLERNASNECYLCHDLGQ